MAIAIKFTAPDHPIPLRKNVEHQKNNVITFLKKLLFLVFDVLSHVNETLSKIVGEMGKVPNFY